MPKIYISKICFSYINLPCIYTRSVCPSSRSSLRSVSPEGLSMYLYLTDMLYLKSVYPSLVSLRTCKLKVVAGRGTSREYWMIYRGPGFHVHGAWCMVHGPPSPPYPGDTQEDWEREKLADGRGGGEGAGEEPIRLRLQESMFLYKSFITLWVHLLTPCTQSRFTLAGWILNQLIFSFFVLLGKPSYSSQW